jgi:hypothetical protein
VTAIKAIETRYAGCRFRSRLEARWAVFFDALGFAWEYEPEGYELGELGRYLPDFRVWDTGSVGTGEAQWIEVKGVHPTPREIDLINELFWVTRTGAAIVYGEIEARALDGFRRNEWALPACVAHYGRTPVGWDMVRPYEVAGYHERLTAHLDRNEAFGVDSPFVQTSLDRACRVVIPNRGWISGVPYGRWPRIKTTVPEAVRAARSARFEHGESG